MLLFSKKYFSIFIICSLFYLLAGCGNDVVTPEITPVPSYYTVKGKITNYSITQPLKDITCKLQSYKSGTIFSAFTETDSNGNYSFSNVPSGRYELTTVKTDYVEVISIFNVNSNITHNMFMIKYDEWSQTHGSDHPYDPSKGYIYTWISDISGVKDNSKTGIVFDLTFKNKTSEKTEGNEYKDIGYTKEDGTIDWNATSTYNTGTGSFYDVKVGNTYTLKAEKSGSVFNTIDDATAIPGKIIYYTMSSSEIDPNALVPMSAYTFLTQGYNANGTLISNPVILDSNQAVTHTYGVVNYIRKKLTSKSTVAFNGTNYTVYSAVPDYMNIANNIPVSTYTNDTSIYSGEQIWLMNSNYLIPNMPDGADPNNIYGVTENIAWLVDPYANNNTYVTTKIHNFQNGWAWDPTICIAAIAWQNLDPTGGWPSGAPTILYNSQNYLMDTIKVAYDPNAIENALQNANYPYADPTGWLSQGAFVPYQPKPGFQINLLRRNTPWGTWNLLNNTCGFFVRSSGQVEIPLVQEPNQSNLQPIPPVVQTWTDQQFTILNLTESPIPGTYDLYPGSEVYYMGNTYLPGSAGLITRWLYYPHMYYPQNPGTIDERDTDGWLGYKGDQQEDVMVWNMAGGDQGGQGRKPYMFGAAEYSPNGIPEYMIRFQHSNSFWYNRDQSDANNIDKLYKGTFYADPGSGTYYNICSIWWTWTTNTGYSLQNGTYQWASDSSGGGSWVPYVTWNADPNVDPNTYNNLIAAGWVYNPPTPGNLSNNYTLAGPNGKSISMSCTRADLPDPTNPEGITWDPIPFAYSDPNSQSPVYNYTITGVSMDRTLKFLIVLEDN